MPRTLTADLLLDAHADVGEGPAWDAAAGTLAWVDITAGLVHRLDLAGGRDVAFDAGGHVGAALPVDGSSLLLARRGDVALLGVDGTVTPLLDVIGDRPDLRFNDAKCDPAGRAFAGTMPYEGRPGAAALYRLGPGPAATEVLGGVTLANGLGWSPDGATLYFVDSGTNRVDAIGYDPATGELGGRRPLVAVPEAAGMPDGLCVDDDGGVWVGLWGGGAVHRYAPDGTLDAVVALPVTQVTSCCFAGEDGRTLVITSAAYQLDGGQRAAQPHAGALFALTPGVTGRPATPWRPVAGAQS